MTENQPPPDANARAIIDGQDGPTMSLDIDITEQQAALFAWLELAGTAWRTGQPVAPVAVDLQNPLHRQAAARYAWQLLNNHFEEHRARLSWGQHEFFSPPPPDPDLPF